MDIRSWPSIRNTIGNGTTRLGERLGVEWMVYNRFVYQMFHEMALHNAPRLAAALVERFPEVQRAVDVGCGTGVLVKELTGNGVETIGCEYSARARRHAASQGVTVFPWRIEEHLEQRLVGSPFDLAVSTEVAEHLPDTLADRFVEFVAGSAPLVVLTAAHPGQGGHGHINEQPQSYWIQRFGKVGMAYQATETAALVEACVLHGVDDWLYGNLMVFREE